MAYGTLYVGNDMLLTVSGLKAQTTGNWINNATVTCTLLDAAGDQIPGATWPLTLSYVAGTNGNYRVVLPDTLSLVAGEALRCHVTADAGDGLKGFWPYDVLVAERPS